ncbi:MAG: TIGR03915 family putative DNA repair protein [Firmicutes bacterium]|nr:TIGR03915 family putative DNA repair protein [Bacillota bacterium]
MIRLKKDADVVYVYDGSFDGFLCCVYESVYGGEFPLQITAALTQETLLPVREIATDMEKARRVLASIPRKISSRALELTQCVFLSCLEEREVKLLRALLRGYREGGRLYASLGDADIAALLAAERHLLSEAHLLKGFVRFADYGGDLVGTITPKNFVLPFLANHFAARYDNENWLLFDKTHQAALIHENRRVRLISAAHVDMPELSEEEARYRSLWKHFYDTVAIEARINPRCRMTHMPKRYWENMLEVRDLL